MESPAAKSAGARCGAQAMFAVSGYIDALAGKTEHAHCSS